MSDELLTSGITLDSDNNNQADLAPANGEDHQNTSDVPTSNDDVIDNGEAKKEELSNDDPAGFSKAINKKHYQMMEEKRRADGLTQRIKELEDRLPKDERPNIPEMPDQYDDDFVEKLKARDNALIQSASFDSQMRFNQQQADLKQQQTLDQQQQDQDKQAQTYVSRAKEQGITEDMVTQSIQTISSMGGVGVDLSSFIMEDENGPAITAHLAHNPSEVEKLQSMSPMQGAVYIESVIKSKVLVSQKNSKAPPPADSLGGGGSPPQEAGPKGATYT